MKHVLRVTGTEDGLELSRLLAARLALEIAEALAWVRAGSVYLDGRRQQAPATLVRAGQEVVARPPRLVSAGPATVVYRDEELAVVEKPAGLDSMPGREGGPSLQGELPALLGESARLMHRLDRETSGLLLCAVSVRARSRLAEAVAGHRLIRAYLALVQGGLEGEQTLRSRLGHRGGRSRGSQDPRAREAVTHLRPLRRQGGQTLVEATLSTGRTHQIRAQLSEAGLPLVGDGRYGGPPAPRLALHAHRLGLALSGRPFLDVHSPLPAELLRLLRS